MQTSEYFDLQVSVDGRLVGGAAASVSVWDHGFLYGDGCFEGLRIYSGRVFRFSDHVARLRRSLQILNIDRQPIDQQLQEEELFTQVCRVAQANDLQDAHVRILVTRGKGAPGIDPRTCERPSLIVMAYPLPPLLGKDPVNLVVSSVLRKAPGSVDSNAKTLNYLDSVLAKTQAIAADANDAIMLDSSQCVSESTSANIFVVSDGELRTPTTRSALPGITRRTVLELADSIGMRAVETDLTVGDLYCADECFLTGSGAGIVPVGSIDGRRIGETHEVTTAVAEAYGELVRSPELTRPIDV